MEINHLKLGCLYQYAFIMNYSRLEKRLVLLEPFCTTLFRVCNYRPQTMLWKGNVFTPVCQSFCSQGGSAPVHAGIPCHPPSPDRHPPQADSPMQTLPWADTPWEDIPPGQTYPGQTPLSRRLLLRTVRILLECILVFLK